MNPIVYWIVSLVEECEHELADALAVGGLVAGERRAALPVRHARKDALRQRERVRIVGPEMEQNSQWWFDYKINVVPSIQICHGK